MVLILDVSGLHDALRRSGNYEPIHKISTKHYILCILAVVSRFPTSYCHFSTVCSNQRALMIMFLPKLIVEHDFVGMFYPINGSASKPQLLYVAIIYLAVILP